MSVFQHPDQFVNRHIGPNESELIEMLKTIGVDSLETLIDETIPDSIRMKGDMNLPEPLSEFDYLMELKNTASKNKLYKNFIGQGYHGTITPSVILRNLFQNPGWYTQYTPYQAEIAQGRLESLLNFQTMVCDLTGLPVANASLLDEATAASEAMTMFYGLKNKRAKDYQATHFLVSKNVFVHTLDVLITRAEPLGIKVIVADPKEMIFNQDVFGVLLQYPAEDGSVEDLSSIVDAAKKEGVFVAVASDIMSLALLTPPGEWGADVVLGNTQRFGVPMGFGGPHAAYFSTKEEHVRNIPGRIIGVSVDTHGNRALRMALQTREQHIRREKATSNICTAQALLSNMAAMYAIYHGPKGIKGIASRIHRLTQVLNQELKSLGFNQLNNHFFDTLKVDLLNQENQESIRKIALESSVNLHYSYKRFVQISMDETSSLEDIALLLSIFAKHQSKACLSVQELESKYNNIFEQNYSFPNSLVRTSEYLTQEVFNIHQSESLMMRYIKSLENKDLSLVHSMISLGSCTMKLNAATELIPVTWDEFSALHPFVPADQSEGYKQIISELETYLCEITGFTACSLQSNSGAQGEYSGLLAIRAYHLSRGDHNRNIALIPSSAHGTNPASAVMAGMQVVVVSCDEKGNINFEDLKSKAEQYKENLSCLMVTYPSTHGVFETAIKDICEMIHQNGGLVYMDGANMNAQVGLTSPGLIGADVCHLNLHKTFAIPHGGGGPGMGPICVNDKLKPFLPKHAMVDAVGGEQGIHAVSAAPWGSASILLISYAYIKMLGAEGCRKSTEYAILNANYIKAKLESAYEVLYTGEKGRAAHELIIDLREFKKYNISAEDVAKRLMDYGFHAPTLSFPVAGTIMIEPTESEDKRELDRFCEALLEIKKEIDEIANGMASSDNNVLVNAPHTLTQITNSNWDKPYTREKAAFPLPFVHNNKFWARVGRVDGAYGDKNLVCVCPPIESYELVN
jgi:glycine dehydrogenase